MSIPVIAFFNNKGGVGKTSLVYHLSYMFSELGVCVVAADLDPQSNLTSIFLDEDRLEQILTDPSHAQTVFGAIGPLLKGTGDIAPVHLETIEDSRVALIPGDMTLSTCEDQLAETWSKCLAGDERAFRVTSAFWRIVQEAGRRHEAQLILVDIGPNLGPINRAALIASDYVVIPLGSDLFSLQGLKNLGPMLGSWRNTWQDMVRRNPIENFLLPEGKISPIGYIVLRHSQRFDRPTKAFERWIERIPSIYAEAVLGEEPKPDLTLKTDRHCLATLKDYRSLMPLAQEARKPMFSLKPADGALGAHLNAAQAAYGDFKQLAETMKQRIQLQRGDV